MIEFQLILLKCCTQYDSKFGKLSNGNKTEKGQFSLQSQRKEMSKECSVQSLSSVQLFATPWTAARQTSLPITTSWHLLKLISIKLVMPSNHLILCCPLLLLLSIFPSIKIFSNESVLHVMWPMFKLPQNCTHFTS